MHKVRASLQSHSLDLFLTKSSDALLCESVEEQLSNEKELDFCLPVIDAYTQFTLDTV